LPAVASVDETAVLFVECQRGVIGDLTTLPALAEAAAPARGAMGRLAAGARDAGVPVFHLLYAPLAGGRSYNRRAALMRATKRSADWTPDHPALQVVEEIGVGPNDIVMTRAQGMSPVYRTETLTVLRNMGVDEVVVAGVSTNWAIPLTVAGVADEDMSPVIPTDAAVGVPESHHQSMLKHALGFVARLTTVDELLSAWATP
jgi:nicotinamidase-related amidase